jgi:hypothetical protein
MVSYHLSQRRSRVQVFKGHQGSRRNTNNSFSPADDEAARRLPERAERVIAPVGMSKIHEVCSQFVVSANILNTHGVRFCRRSAV